MVGALYELLVALHCVVDVVDVISACNLLENWIHCPACSAGNPCLPFIIMIKLRLLH